MKNPEIHWRDVQEMLSQCEIDDCVIVDNGELVYHSRIYQWKDGTYHNEPENEIHS